MPEALDTTSMRLTAGQKAWLAVKLAAAHDLTIGAGIALTELRSAEGAGLEDMFLSLTADTQREGVAA